MIEAIRIWIRSMVYDQNPLPTLTTLFNNYGIKKTDLHFDDFMGCIALSSNKKYDFVIYTDGACLGNPGSGGWAAIIINKFNKKNELSGSEKNTTNNRMELLACINALSFTKSKDKLKIYTDSKYVIDGIKDWILKWKNNGWLTANKKSVKNVDLWVKLDLLIKDKEIEWEWVKGHSGNKFNEEADSLARKKAGSLN